MEKEIKDDHLKLLTMPRTISFYKNEKNTNKFNLTIYFSAENITG